jgi:hypothetical protein
MADISLSWEVVGNRWYSDPYAPDLGNPWAELRNEASWPGYSFTVRFSPDMLVKGLDVDSGDGRSLTAALLRQVPLGEIAAAARAHMSWFWTEYERGRPVSARRARPISNVMATAIDMHRRGRSGRPDAELAVISRQYVQCCAAHRKAPMLALAEQTNLEPAQLRGLLHQARKRGLLTATPGKGGIAGGALTPKARHLLAIPPPPDWDLATAAMRQSAIDVNDRFRAINIAIDAGQITTEESVARRLQLFEAFFEPPTSRRKVPAG